MPNYMVVYYLKDRGSSSACFTIPVQEVYSTFSIRSVSAPGGERPANTMIKCGVNFFILASRRVLAPVYDRSQPCAYGDVIWPQPSMCRDPIASKHILNPDFAPWLYKKIQERCNGSRLTGRAGLWGLCQFRRLCGFHGADFMVQMSWCRFHSADFMAANAGWKTIQFYQNKAATPHTYCIVVATWKTGGTVQHSCCHTCRLHGNQRRAEDLKHVGRCLFKHLQRAEDGCKTAGEDGRKTAGEDGRMTAGEEGRLRVIGEWQIDHHGIGPVNLLILTVNKLAVCETAWSWVPCQHTSHTHPKGWETNPKQRKTTHHHQLPKKKRKQHQKPKTTRKAKTSENK